MIEFATGHEIIHEITCGLLLPTTEKEVKRLQALATRFHANGVPSEILSRDSIKELQPFAQGISALHIETTRIINFAAVAQMLVAHSKKTVRNLC